MTNEPQPQSIMGLSDDHIFDLWICLKEMVV